MKKVSALNIVVAAIASGFALHVAVAQTAETRAAATERSSPMADRGTNYSDRARIGSWNSEKEMLEQALKVGAKTDDYMKTLSAKGYTITSINEDSAAYVEYEIVKGDHSFEVQIDRNKITGISTEVSVDRNLWRTDATKEALRSGKAVAALTPLSNGRVYSDRANSRSWNDEKERLEKRLGLGKEVAFYNSELKELGYQITSVNDKDKDYVEYEVVKGRDTYEVQMDLNDAGRVEKLDVTSNMWQTEATEKALEVTK